MSYLIFIDTNIYLDFYRYRGLGSDASLSILKHFDKSHDRIITTSEVQMEYMKNRQRVILDSLKSMKHPDTSSLVVPSFLQESKPNKAIKAAQDQLAKQSALVRKRTAKLLQSPSHNDPVYRTLQRLFRAKGPSHLMRGSKIRANIRELANKRFNLGYPPKKNSDLSIGDAINWEWIIHCAQSCSDDIVIVSRDSDYGVYYEGKSILNDWLHQEFKERVSHKRSIELTARLTEAFKLVAITVSTEEERSEESLIETRRASSGLQENLFSDLDTLPTFNPAWPNDVKLKWFNAFNRVLRTWDDLPPKSN